MNYKEKVIEIYVNGFIDNYEQNLENMQEVNNGIVAFYHKIIDDNYEAEFDLYDYPEYCERFIYHIQKKEFNTIDTRLVLEVLNNMVMDKVKVKMKDCA